MSVTLGSRRQAHHPCRSVCTRGGRWCDLFMVAVARTTGPCTRVDMPCVHVTTAVMPCVHVTTAAMQCVHVTTPAMSCVHMSTTAMSCVYVTTAVMLCVHVSTTAMPCVHVTAGNVAPRAACRPSWVHALRPRPTEHIYSGPEMDMGWVHPCVGLGRLDTMMGWVHTRVGLGSMTL